MEIKLKALKQVTYSLLFFVNSKLQRVIAHSSSTVKLLININLYKKQTCRALTRYDPKKIEAKAAQPFVTSRPASLFFRLFWQVVNNNTYLLVCYIYSKFRGLYDK